MKIFNVWKPSFKKHLLTLGIHTSLKGYTTFEGVYIKAQKQGDFQDNSNTRTLPDRFKRKWIPVQHSFKTLAKFAMYTYHLSK